MEDSILRKLPPHFERGGDQLPRLRELEILEQNIEGFIERFKRASKNRTTARVLAATILSLLSITFHNWFESGQPDIVVTVEQVLRSLRDVACETRKLK